MEVSLKSDNTFASKLHTNIVEVVFMTDKKLKIILTITLILNLIPNTLIVSATQSAPDPYMLVRQIPRPPLSVNQCLSILAKPIMLSNSQIEIWQNQYDTLMKEIAIYEGQEEDSLAGIQKSIDDLVDQLYTHYSQEDDTFNGLSTDEQLAIIQADSLFQEWQTYYDQQLANYYQLIHQAEEISTQMKQTEIVETQADTILNDESINENQCQLYAYSMPQLSPDTILLDQHTNNLQDYLRQVGDYLNKIVPSAYKMVTFQAIQDMFNRQDTLEELETQLSNKQNVKIDVESLNQYSYEKVLSLAEIETYALLALRDYHHHQDDSALKQAYHDIIDTKEKQYQYFYAINQPAFNRLSEMLANYLNDKQLNDAESFEKVKQFQADYQLKLVFFQEDNQSWVINPGHDSGYRLEFSDIASHQDQNRSQLDQIESVFLYSNHDEHERESENSDIASQSLNQNDNLAALKEKLNQQKSQVEKPNRSNLRDQLNSPPKNDNKKANGLQLPSTGESSIFTWIAGGLLLVGILLLIVNRWLHFKDKKKRQEIELD